MECNDARQRKRNRSEHQRLDFGLGAHDIPNAQIVHLSFEIEIEGLANMKFAGTLKIRRGGVTSDHDTVAVNRAGAIGSVVGASPMVPILIRKSVPRGEVVAPEVKGEDVVLAKANVKKLIRLASALADDEFGSGARAFGPELDGERAVRQIDLAGGDRHIVIHAIEAHRVTRSGSLGAGWSREDEQHGKDGESDEVLSVWFHRSFEFP